MSWLRTIRLRFSTLFRKQKLDAQMDEEMRSHIEMQTQENIETGGITWISQSWDEQFPNANKTAAIASGIFALNF